MQFAGRVRSSPDGPSPSRVRVRMSRVRVRVRVQMWRTRVRVRVQQDRDSSPTRVRVQGLESPSLFSYAISVNILYIGSTDPVIWTTVALTPLDLVLQKVGGGGQPTPLTLWFRRHWAQRLSNAISSTGTLTPWNFDMACFSFIIHSISFILLSYRVSDRNSLN